MENKNNKKNKIYLIIIGILVIVNCILLYLVITRNNLADNTENNNTQDNNQINDNNENNSESENNNSETENNNISEIDTTEVYKNLSFIINNVLEHQAKNHDYMKIEEGVKINGDLLTFLDYKLDFAFVYSFVNKSKTKYYGDEVTGETGAYWIKENDFNDILNDVYGEKINYSKNEYIDDGYYKSAIFTGWFDEIDEELFKETSLTEENGLIITTADIYSSINYCVNNTNKTEKECTNNRPLIGTIVIKFKVENSNYIFKSISLYEKK